MFVVVLVLVLFSSWDGKAFRFEPAPGNLLTQSSHTFFNNARWDGRSTLSLSLLPRILCDMCLCY